MEFKFDPNQQYQLDAIQAVTDLFNGQPDMRGLSVSVDEEIDIVAAGNRLALDYDALLQNLRTVQERSGLTLSDKLAGQPVTADLTSSTTVIVDGEGNPLVPNYSIEMETGTGKTYVYLRTIFQSRSGSSTGSMTAYLRMMVKG